MNNRIGRWTGVVALCALATSWTADAQWTNRYPKVTGFNHQVYLEGYELPVLGAGPTDPAPAPDGGAIAVAARGWLWLLDTATGEARRLTRGGAMDSRPAWSPDGRRLAFVRDTGKETSVVEIDVTSLSETVLVDTPAMDLDPAYARDGRSLFYSSAEAGDFDIWRLDLTTKAKTRVTEDRGNELNPQPLAGDAAIAFVAKVQGTDSIVVLDPGSKQRQTLTEQPIASQMRLAAHPDGRSLVAALPSPDSWDLWLFDTGGGPPIRVAHGGKTLMPAWTAAGDAILFVEADADRQFGLKRVGRGGGPVTDVPVLTWDWGEPTARVLVRTRRAGTNAPLPSRLHVVDWNGHPAIPATGQVWFDGQSGLVFTYSPGVLAFEVPAGAASVKAAAGFGTAAVAASVTAAPGASAAVDIDFTQIWDARANGWYSGDHHFHMNYGGPYVVRPEHLVPMMQGEDLDVGTPLMANLHTRVNDLEWLEWKRLGSGVPLIAFGQEIRPHFLGHIGVIGIASPYWPWYWGPGYPVYTRDDRPTGDALAHARQQGGVNSYVHPVMRPGPFPGGGKPPAGLPLSLVTDAMLGDVDTIEVACLWSDEIGSSEAWYRLLNVGAALTLSAGTDAMTDFYRTMAIGSTRVYVKPEPPMTLESYLAALRAGRSFVSTGPLLQFTAGSALPGGVIQTAAGGEISWHLSVATPVAFDFAEVLVNGAVVWSSKGPAAAGTQTWTGRVKAPSGGWIAARVRGGVSEWPTMDSYPFAHTGPAWFGRVGSTDRDASRVAAGELLQWMDVADQRLAEGYAGADIPRLKARFAEARRRLEAIAASGRTRPSQ